MGHIKVPLLSHILYVLYYICRKATFTWVWLKRFPAEQQFYGNVCVGKVWLKCIWQSFHTDLIEENACQHLEPWTGGVQSPQILQTFLGDFCWLEIGCILNQVILHGRLYFLVALQVPGTLCQKIINFCSPKSTASCTSKIYLKRWAETQKGWEQWHDIPPRIDLIPDARLSLTSGIASRSTHPIFSPMYPQSKLFISPSI